MIEESVRPYRAEVSGFIGGPLREEGVVIGRQEEELSYYTSFEYQTALSQVTISHHEVLTQLSDFFHELQL